MARTTPRTATALFSLTLLICLSAMPTMAWALPTAQLTISAPLAVRADTPFVARGTAVGGVAAGETIQVLLQRKSETGWTTVSSTPAAVDGSQGFSAKLTATSRDHWRVVAETPATAAHSAALSSAAPVKAVGKKVIALTFDDGPWRSSTDSILATLKRENAQATFFMLGTQVKGQPTRARAVVSQGNEAGVHSWNHANMAKRSSTSNAKDLKRSKSTLAGIIGHEPVWFRPPYGATSSALRKTAAGLGLRQVIWTADTLDWKNRNAGIIASRAIKGAKPGGVILMHDGGGNRSATAKAVPMIIKSLRKRGYDFVTMSELAALGYKIR